jgi:formate--tetrahydrofolate ligase
MKPITHIAEALEIAPEHLLPYGRDKAKVDLASLADRPRADSKLVLVSAITPTPAGEGKTTTTIGLSDALRARGKSVCAALREPSLGPCFGVKGGGTGGGRAQLAPMESINLHFTGDFHAIAAAHNLLAAVIDNLVHRGDLGLEPRRVTWRRVVDMNDRSLRNIVCGLGGPASGAPRETGCDITAASEIMAILALSEGPEDLRARLDRIVIGYRKGGDPVRAAETGCVGAMMALLKDAIAPNLVQTLEGTPALVHCGPFANIAHGCNSVLATRMGLAHADLVITEAGFGFDLGAEKFFDIKCRTADLCPRLVVLVASVRALAMHGDGDVAAGLSNLEKHIESVQAIHGTPVVALNRFDGDRQADIDIVAAACAERGVPFAVAEHFARGGEGALELADIVADRVESGPAEFTPVYELDAPVVDKIRSVTRTVYGGSSVVLGRTARRQLALVESLGGDRLPICIAKTQSSLSDDPKQRGRPTGFEIAVAAIQLDAGAGFLVVLTGDILRMPGLPAKPQAMSIDLVDGEIVGLR